MRDRVELDLTAIRTAIERIDDTESLSGVVSIHLENRIVFGQGFGFANRSESIPNTLDTRFQTASGCKIFTGIAVARLVQRGDLSFDTPLTEALAIELPHFDPGVTIHHLLTHTSGIPDYFDEEAGVDFEELWIDRPMYRFEKPQDFLPMFQNGRMQFEPGARFKYSGSAFILLGLIIEEQTAIPFPDFVQREIFTTCGMNDSGYFRFDRLPPRTALSYIEDDRGGWRTNIYSVPIVGGPDGGAYVTLSDMAKFWDALHASRLLDPDTTRTLLRNHVEVPGGRRPTQYGYGVWRTSDRHGRVIHYVEGWDPGVTFLSASDGEGGLVLTIALNTNRSAWKVFESIEPLLIGTGQ